jgi:hypothetical protein
MEPARRVIDSAAQERFCDEFASHLLVPREAAVKVTRVSELLRLQERCDVSLEVATRAVSTALPHRWIALWHSGPGDSVRPQWSSDGYFPHLRDLSAVNIEWVRLTDRDQVVAVSR